MRKKRSIGIAILSVKQAEGLQRGVLAVHLTPFDACSSVAVIQDMPAILFLAHTPENKLNQIRSAEGDRPRF